VKELAIVALLAVAPTAQALDVVGVQLGAPLDADFRARHTGTPDGWCGDDYCRYKQRLGEEGIASVYVKAPQGRIGLVQVTVAGGAIDSVRRGAEEKFGKPTSQRVETVQNGFGAKWPNHRAVWTRKDGTVTFDEHCGVIDKACLTATAPWYKPAKPPAAKL
jgi:hypothetical protein